MKKRLLALLLSALMATSVAACAGNDTSTDTTAAPVSTTAPADETTVPAETELTPDLPEIKFEGTSLTFACRPRDATNYKARWLMADEMNGDIINDAVFERNTYIEEKYGIELVFVESDDPIKLVSTGVQAGDDEYDVMYDKFKKTGTTALNGYLYNIADFGYANYDNPWWDSNSVEGMSYNGKLYAVVCDISLMACRALRGVIFNRDLIREYQMEDPYQLVKDNKWTIDQMISMLTQVSSDLDGNQAMDDADRYGMLTETGSNSNAYYLTIASGVKLFEKNGTEASQAFMNEKTMTILEKCASFMNDKMVTRSYNDLTPDSDGKWFYGRKLFAADHFLFLNNSVGQFDEFNAAGMESEYGILPQPKYDANQERYYHPLDRETTCLSIPASNKEEDLERISILLEDMAYKSSKTILPAYYDNVIALRRARVPEVAEMVAIMKSSIYYDISTLFTLDYSTPLSAAIESGNAASIFKTYEKVLNLQVKQMTTKLDALP
ncbi:MAG: extracellular solute-binding protein [Clostridia bacterium]|nr:extracellular solute-binding protein [Clostridia bacterium]